MLTRYACTIRTLAHYTSLSRYVGFLLAMHLLSYISRAHEMKRFEISPRREGLRIVGCVGRVDRMIVDPGHHTTRAGMWGRRLQCSLLLPPISRSPTVHSSFPSFGISTTQGHCGLASTNTYILPCLPHTGQSIESVSLRAQSKHTSRQFDFRLHLKFTLLRAPHKPISSKGAIGGGI